MSVTIFLAVLLGVFYGIARLHLMAPTAVLPFGPFFPDFGLDPDFFEEIGPDLEERMMKIDLFEHACNNALDVM